MYNQGPFANWVPKPVMLLLIVAMLLPIAVIGGIYTSNITDIAGGLGTYTEYISVANNATTIGMALGISIMMRIKMRFRTKEIMVGGTIILALLSLMNGTTQNPQVLIAGSLLIGFVKIFPMIEMMLPVLFMLSPKGERGRFYSLFYPMIIVASQVSGYGFSRLMFQSNYQAPYFLMAAIMLSIAALCLVFQHNQRFSFKMPLYQVDWLSLILLAGGAMGLNYGLSFMKQQGWFQSPAIVGLLAGGLLLIALTIYRQKFLKRKMFHFDLFLKRDHIWHSLVLLLFLGLYLASSGVFVQYSMGVLGYSNLINAGLNLWMIPGLIASGVICFFGFKKGWHLKWAILGGFGAFFLHTVMLYFLIQPQLNITSLYLPMMLKGLGMGLLFIVVWYYAAIDLTPDKSLGVTAIMLMVRTFVATAVGSALLGWAGYAGQWQSFTDMAGGTDSGSGYGALQLSALMASGKIVLGVMSWLFIPIALFVITHHYGRFNYRRMVFFRKLVRGNSVKGYALEG